jgi:hypothetical protein
MNQALLTIRERKKKFGAAKQKALAHRASVGTNKNAPSSRVPLPDYHARLVRQRGRIEAENEQAFHQANRGEH